MENTNTDARKAAEIALEQITGYVQGNQLNIPKSWIIDAMVSFAEFQSRPATLDKGRLSTKELIDIENKTTDANQDLRKAEMKKAAEFMGLYLGGNPNTSSLTPLAIQEMMIAFAQSLSEQPEAKPTEPESKLSPDLAYNSEANVSQNAECEKAIPIQKIIDLVNSYWRFNKFQEPISTWHEKQDFLKEIEKLQPEPEQVEKIYSEEFLTWRGKWFVKDNMVYPWKNKQGVRYSDEDLHKSFEQAMRESPFKPSTL